MLVLYLVILLAPDQGLEFISPWPLALDQLPSLILAYLTGLWGVGKGQGGDTILWQKSGVEIKFKRPRSELVSTWRHGKVDGLISVLENSCKVVAFLPW